MPERVLIVDDVPDNLAVLHDALDESGFTVLVATNGESALARARQRIDYFSAHPAQHALYAAKVLIKYQMMDVERMPRPAFMDWLARAPALHLLHQQHRPDLGWDDWLAQVLAPLFDKGALKAEGAEVVDGG